LPAGIHKARHERAPEELEIVTPRPAIRADAQLLREQRWRLLFEFAVMFHELPVRVYLETGFFPVRFVDDLIVPFAIRIVFPNYLNDISACRLLLDCLLNRCGGAT
jgi:hypothetical protein